MVAPMVVAAGITAAGGILGSLFGKKKKSADVPQVVAPVIPQFEENPQSRAAVDSMFGDGGTKEQQARFLTQNLLGSATYKTQKYTEYFQDPNELARIRWIEADAQAALNTWGDWRGRNRRYSDATKSMLNRQQAELARLKANPTMLSVQKTRQVQTGYAGNGLLDALNKAPQMGSFENTELNNATNTYTGMLELARINAMNDTAQSLQGMQSQFGLSGGAFGDSGSRAMGASITAKNQSGLNAYASETANNILNFRSKLLEGVYQRLINKYNATVGLQGQLSGQGSAMINTGLSYNLAVDQAKSGVNVSNAGLASQAGITNSSLAAQSNIASGSNKTSMFGAALSSGASLLGQFIGKK